MPSRLSSLLVRDGLVGVKRMEQAFQRQVIYGGNLDTILLEMKIVPEARLLQYLSLSTGLPPATRAETEVFDAEALKRCDAALATEYRVVPLSVEDGALRVLVRDPVDLAQLEELANEMEIPIQPLVVPEYRYHVVFARTYDRELDARFAALAKEAEDESATAPVGKPRTVIVEAPAPAEEDRDHVVVDVPDSPAGKRAAPGKGRTKTQRLSTDALAVHLAETEKERKQAAAAPADSAAVEEPVQEAASEPIPTPVDDEADLAERQRIRGLLREDAAPLEPRDAAAALEIADERDLIFAVLLRAVRSRARYAGLLTVQGRVAIGRLAIDGDELDREQVTKVLVPLDAANAFSKAVTQASPYIGPIGSGDAETDGMIKRLGGVVPPAALLLPIVLRNRVVALVVAHRGADTIGIAEVSELLPLAGEAAAAVSRLIMKAKAVGYRKASAEEAAPEVPVDELPTKKLERKQGEWTAPDESDPPAAQDIDFSSETAAALDESSTSIEELLDTAEREEADEEASRDAIQEAIRRSDETLVAIYDRFPGKLRVDRHEMGARVLRATEHGPLLEIVVQLGAAAADLLIDKMRDPERDVRYYAALCCAELRPRSALRPLVERLFDEDHATRALALDALSGYPISELEDGLEYARHAIHSGDQERVRAAAHALAELADVRSIPDLLDATSRDDESSSHTRRALVQLTKQNFGTSARKWRSWWNKNKRRNRVEWLIEALGHKDEELRRSAAEDLRKMTGEYFGFHHDLPKKERQQARQRWERWWEETGRRRFLRSGADERHRPTAVLPSRQD